MSRDIEAVSREVGLGADFFVAATGTEIGKLIDQRWREDLGRRRQTVASHGLLVTTEPSDAGILTWTVEPEGSGKPKQQWFAGGDLHKSSVAQWRSALGTAKLATAADWALSIPSVNAAVDATGDVHRVKPYAAALIMCVDKVVEAAADATPLPQLVVPCTLLMSW